MTSTQQSHHHIIPVIICDGGPVGLSLSLALGKFGIKNRLIEKHPRTSIHPKARGVNVRTMGLFRSWGIESTILKHELSAKARRLRWMTSLKGDTIAELTINETEIADSPSNSCLVTQDFVE